MTKIILGPIWRNFGSSRS